jgi:hypothetical protein
MESTEDVVEINGTLCRVWRGTFGENRKCDVYVLALGAEEDQDAMALRIALKDLVEQKFTLILKVEDGE